ncbi:hypothetical protein Tco_1346251 [Tanacetum coccineum]
MSGIMPPIPPPPFRTSSSNPISPQLLDSRGGSHVTNVPAFDAEDFTSWKVRFMVFLDGLKPYLLKTLEDGPFCKTVKEIWNDLILAHEGPSDTRDTKIAALRLKFNAFKSLEGEKDSDSNVMKIKGTATNSWAEFKCWNPSTSSQAIGSSLLVPDVPKACFEKKAYSSTEQLLLTLIEEVKGLKRQIEIPSGTPPSSSQPSKILGADQLLVILCYRYQESGIGYFMSSASSAVTYTSVYTDSEPGRVFWGADEEILL